SPRASFRELLRQTRDTALAAYSHQELPFERLVEELNPQRSLSHTPLFQVMLVLQNQPRTQLALPGLDFRVQGLDSRTTKFDFTLMLHEESAGLQASVEYNAELYDAASMQRLLRHLRALLVAATTSPDQPLAGFSLLSEDERRQVLLEWNPPRAGAAPESTLHECFSEQARRTPDALAVVRDDTQLTFGALEARSNQLAHHLVALGIGPDAPVVLCLERSVEALVAILGTLKAGGAYVPVDPSYPQEWKDFVLKDTRARVVLTQRHLASALPATEARVVCLGSDGDALTGPDTAPIVATRPENLAYVIYTSGSTGRPKGVMVPHRNALHLRQALASTVYAGTRGPLRVSVNAPLSFDASVKQLIQVLDGHTLCFVPEEDRGDMARMLRRIEKDRLDVLDCSPAHLRLLLEEGLLRRPGILLQRVLVGGEAVDVATWAQLARATNTRFFNVYGPTECTVDATACAVSEFPDAPRIGRPLPGVPGYVLDASLRPVPVGIPGELFIGGLQVARGYLQRPALSAERFVPDPFSATPGARMYRTGDLVRWREDGQLEYFHRIDHQVKVRGFRIEPGEIEAALLEHPALKEAVVVARQDAPGDARLVAYAVAHESSTPEARSGESLRDFLRQRLPEHMVPTAFVLLEALPLTPNGKVDRKALPAPDASAATAEYVAPSTPTEEQLADLWAEVLRLPRVGARDHFFDAGGHSLRATQLVARVRATFSVELPLRAIFEAPVLADLARRIDAAGKKDVLPALTRTREPRTEPLELSFAQQRLWFLDQLQPGKATYNMPYALRLAGALDVPALQGAFTELVRRHESLRTTFTRHLGSPRQLIHPPSAWVLPVQDLSALPTAEREARALELALAGAQRPFHLGTGPLLRTELLKLSDTEHVLLVCMHHIVSDGWSMGVLVREMATLYEAFTQGLPSPLPELRVQYADFAAWQREWLQGSALQAQLDYWSQQLAGVPTLELPTDKPRPALHSNRGASHAFRLPASLSASLRQLAQDSDTTLFMVLLSAFQVLLARYSGQDDISVGSPIANRTDRELEPLIGFFVNTLVLRSRLDGDPRFTEVLARVKEASLGAFAHQDVPFEQLVETLGVVRDLGRTPLFQVVFSLQSAPTQPPALAGVRTERLLARNDTSKFDLALTMTERAGPLEAQLEYCADLFEPASMERLAGHFQALLEGIVENPRRLLSQLPPEGPLQLPPLRPQTPAPNASTGPAPFVSPHTPLEETLAAIWAEVLDGPAPGVHDNFFERGGSSLSSVLMLARVQDSLGVEVPLERFFAAPTIAELASALQDAPEPEVRAPPLTIQPRPDALPLSFAQQRLWFLHQFKPGDTAYNISASIRMEGELDIGALEHALTGLVLRHEVLRTHFASTEAGPVQVISQTPPTLAHVDLRALPDAERTAELQRLTSEDARHPFALERGPLLRMTLVALGEREHVLLVSMHHIISDGWSAAVMVRELVALYQAHSTGQPPALSPLPLQYADYTLWQRDRLQGDVLQEQLDYWRQQLQGAPALLELPTDRPRPAVLSFRGARLQDHLPREVVEPLNALALQERATPFMALLAAFQVLLARYSGQDDISVGSPISGRTHPELEGLVGFFVNTLVLRGHLSPRASFRELLRQTRDTALAAYSHQELPFERLVEELNPQRSLSHTPLFQVMLVLQNQPRTQLALPGLDFRVQGLDSRTAKFDFTLGFNEESSGLQASVDYNAELYDAASMQRLLRHLRALLVAATTSPDQPLAGLSLLSEDERHQVLRSWNDTARPFDLTSVPTRFELQARRTPDAPAVIHGDERLTYGQLHERVARLSRSLRARGVGADVPVALCLRRSPDMVAAMFAILHAGGAYVPLDPGYPADRLAWMLQDSGARVLITERSLLGTVPADGLDVLLLDEVAEGERASTPVAADADALAYVIYTSGSTGRPKGVMVTRRTAANLLDAVDAWVNPSEPGTWLAVTSISFDIHVLEILWTLTRGFQVVLHDEQAAARGDAPSLSQVLRRHTITHLQCTPSFARTLVLAPESVVSLGALRHLIVGGEALAGTLARQLCAALPTATLINGYGPTETTVYSTSHAVDPKDPAAVISIGGPVANTRVYVLDGQGEPAPVGVSGELFIAGAGVVRGYHRRPELTAERFVPDGFSSMPGARMYRTGDLARWHHDGTLEFLGRTDFQVKVRGFRIELGEVEAVLSRHPDVGQVVAGARRDGADNGQLVAWVAPKPGHAVDASLLRTFARERLPEYMVPSRIMALDAFPLTPNGKVDRKALPAPDAVVLERAQYVPPGTPLEQQVADLFSALLRVPRVGAHDNFFELGGHSLLATQLVSRLRSTFGVELPLRALFEASSVQALASRVDAALQSGLRSEAPPLVPMPRPEELPLSFAQQRLWLIDQLQPGSSTYNIPAVVRLEGPLHREALRQALSALVQRHEALRTCFPQRHGQPFQLIAPPSSLPLREVDLEGLGDATAAEARRLVSHESTLGFDLAQGPLVRALLLRLAQEEHVLVLTLHHIVSDGWSMGVLVREVAALYEAFRQGLPSPLPALPVQYADYALWQRGWLHGDVLHAQLAYWRQQLTGAASLELPTDKPRPAVQSFRGASVPVLLPTALAERLRALGHQHSVTPFMLLLAVWQALLSRYSGQADVSVGSPIAGRQRSETEGLIGFFVNTLVLRSQVDASRDFLQLLRGVREVALGAFAHQDVPFERLVEELRPERDMSRSPLFQALFALQNAPAAGLQLRELALRPVENESPSTRFDLELTLSESPQGFSGGLRYNRDLFSASTAQRLASHFRAFAEALVAQPEAPLASVSFLSEDERRQLLVDWNDTATEYPRGTTLPEVFAQVVAHFPEKCAVESESLHLTYRQLDERANQLAWHLRRLGVSTDSRVALALERSVELVVALVAILKAGGAYVSLDPAYPRERLVAMLEDTGPRVLLTSRELLPKLPHAGLTAVVLEDVALDAEALQAPPPAALSDSLAYVDFTSGSTGRPKGVGTTHAGVLRTVFGVDYAHFGPDETLLLMAPIAFDASTLELWGALLHGSKLAVYPPHAVSDAHTLETVLIRHGVTTLWLTAGLFTQVVDTHLPALRSVRQVLTGGDVIPPGPVRRVLEELRIPVTAGYGPTETTVFATSHRFTSAEQVGTTIPLGRPLGNTRVYVLDAAGQLVPVGVTGELFVGGDGLARGYIGQPSLTADRFIPNPFSATPGARLYRTGDLVRWGKEGVLEFLGRADAQVKVRGYRIELSEVEGALSSFPGVREAVAMAREDQPGDKRLVGYFAAPESLSLSELRTHLQQRLPEYMVPSSLVRLEALPLTANAKVDRKALPVPESALAARHVDHVAPRTPTEELVASLFAQVLRVERVSVQEDFFLLGGHSLLATQLVSRLRSTFGVELPLRALFEASSVQALASRVDAALQSGLRSEAPPLVPMPRPEELPLSFAQQRLWLIDQLQPGSSTYNIPAVVRLEGPLHREALRQALSALVQRHEALRTCFPQRHGQPFQLIAPPSSLPLREVDLEGLGDATAAEARRLVSHESTLGFDLAQGPLVRALLLRLAQEEHVLVLTLHHIVSDGWSMGVLVREVAALYEAFRQGLPSPLPALPVQYADYALWQRGWLHGDVLHAQLAYWRQQLTGAASLELPTDKPRPAVQSFRGASVPVLLPTALAERLRALGHQHSVTPFMLLLAVWQALLSRYSGQADVSVGSPIAGRQRSETEGLIGFFVNTLVLRSQVDASRDFLQLLRGVREVALGAFAHQDVPFERLVEELRPERDMSRSPLFQALFALQNAPAAGLQLRELALRPVENESPSTRFDLELTLSESPQGFSGGLRYNRDLFSASTAQRLASHFRAFAEALVAQPEAPLASVSFLSEDERRQLLVDWNDTRADFPDGACVHELFAAQARKTPDAVALRFGDAHLTYRQLDERSNQLAHALVALGVGPDTPVALCLERSFELLVALFGVLKAGGAYVPLDPAYPRERLAFMLEDCAAPVLLSHSSLRHELLPYAGHLLCLDEAEASLRARPLTAPTSRVTAENLAYVIYTSGSTGRPKGVMVAHRGVPNLTLALARATALRPGQRVLQFASFSFDAAVYEVTLALLSGATLCLASRDELLPGPSLVEVLRKHAIDSVLLPPSVLALLPTEGLEGLGTLISGGEACTAEVVSRWAPGRRFFNAYGPTEATVIASLHPCAEDASGPPPIG
ncbi:amino acid adenylation domain-containing protein, partial [Corallococcus llansteffanensis]